MLPNHCDFQRVLTSEPPATHDADRDNDCELARLSAQPGLGIFGPVDGGLPAHFDDFAQVASLRRSGPHSSGIPALRRPA
jgi:hypothetical protein